jgi:hypothetical protein
MHAVELNIFVVISLYQYDGRYSIDTVDPDFSKYVGERGWIGYSFLL